MSTPVVSVPAAPPRPVTVPTTARAAAVRRPPVPEASRSARQRAAAILEVLAGTRTPAEAAQALELSLQRYYLLEEKALVGLVAACEPAPRGPGGNEARRWAALERECQRWRQESARQQALVRATQRTIGLAPPAPAKDKGKKRRRHRPVVRALQAAARLRQEAPAGEASGEAPSTTTPSES
jgi:hypothetical protein